MQNHLALTLLIIALIGMFYAVNASPDYDYEGLDKRFVPPFIKRGMRQNNAYNWGATFRGPSSAFW